MGNSPPQGFLSWSDQKFISHSVYKFLPSFGHVDANRVRNNPELTWFIGRMYDNKLCYANSGGYVTSKDYLAFDELINFGPKNMDFVYRFKSGDPEYDFAGMILTIETRSLAKNENLDKYRQNISEILKN